MDTPNTPEGEQQMRLPFGEALRLRRKAMNMTQRELGDAVGADQTTITKWEHGSRPPRDKEALNRLAEILECTVEDLAQGVVPREIRMDTALPTEVVPSWAARAIRRLGQFLNEEDWRQAVAYLEGKADTRRLSAGGGADSDLSDNDDGAPRQFRGEPVNSRVIAEDAERYRS
jgi:transcriptional regulator with XRE-family HTH domain